MTDFNDALETLRRSLAGQTVPELTGAGYTRRHDRFEAASPQRDLLAEAIGARVTAEAARRGRPVRLLSIGCGDGALDEAVLEGTGGAVGFYCGLDPNADQIAACRARLSGREGTSFLHRPMGGEVEGAPFDVVHAVHVIYYAPDPRVFVRQLADTLAEGGLGLIAVAPRSPMNEIADLFWLSQGTDALFADEVEALLAEEGLRFEREAVEAAMPLRLFTGDMADRDIVEFTVQADLSRLPAEADAALEAAFRAAAVDSADGQVLEHPVDCFWLRG